MLCVLNYYTHYYSTLIVVLSSICVNYMRIARCAPYPGDYFVIFCKTFFVIFCKLFIFMHIPEAGIRPTTRPAYLAGDRTAPGYACAYAARMHTHTRVSCAHTHTRPSPVVLRVPDVLRLAHAHVPAHCTPTRAHRARYTRSLDRARVPKI